MLLTAATRTIAHNKARRVFFSFHYQNDLWRAQVVKNSWVTAENREGAGFWNASLETEAKTKGDAEIKQMIDEALIGCSVTAILIGSGTTPHKYVLYEIQKSYDEGKGLLGVRMHRIKNLQKETLPPGNNPLDSITVPRKDRNIFGSDIVVQRKLSEIFKTYDFAAHDGYYNLGAWVEEAIKLAGRKSLQL